MARDTSPARYMGRVRASELDFEMMVLSRAKKAASIEGMVGQERVPSGRQNRPAVCLAHGELGTIGPAQKPTLRPAPSHGSSSTPPEEPCAFCTVRIIHFA